MKNSESNMNMNLSKSIGIIPDFFHDILAYIIPGFTAIILFFVNQSIFYEQTIDFYKDIDFTTLTILVLVAYVIGRFFEQLGKITIHSRKFQFIGKKRKDRNPKWSLLFDDSNNDYTQEFRNGLRAEIEDWLQNTFEEPFLTECEEENRDDYFNLIKFNLGVKFPTVAQYEKKQNANIVLTRSLSLIFVINIVLYFFLSANNYANISFSVDAAFWLSANFIFALVFYSRFKQDRKYYAMYVFENFLSLKDTRI